MKVSEVMTRDVKLVSPTQSIRDAAKTMAECDAGALPVGEGDRLVGVITDRDIAIRAVGENKGPETPVRDVMTRQVLYCFEDETVDHVAANMGEQQVRRLPVMNREKRLVGIVSIGDVSRNAKANTAGKAVAAISQPGGGAFAVAALTENRGQTPISASSHPTRRGARARRAAAPTPCRIPTRRWRRTRRPSPSAPRRPRCPAP